MIKKIGSNKYGVVEYAISSVEDIADLPLGVAIGSTAVLIDKDGIRTFALGEGEWVEYIDAERYDKNKLAQDLLFCGFGNDGEKHDDLDDRLMVEFDEINERVSNGDYLEYNGCEVKADYSLEGLQRGVMLEGRTLQNVVGDFYEVGSGATYDETIGVGSLNYDNSIIRFEKNLIKPNTKYTILINIIKNTIGESTTSPIKISVVNMHSNSGLGYCDVKKEVGFCRFLIQGCEELDEGKIIITRRGGLSVSGEFEFKDFMVLEGDHTETPIEELPFIEGIESVGDKSKNLFDGRIEEGQFTSTGEPLSSSMYIRSVNFIKVKPNTPYILSYKNSDIKLGIYEYDINKNFIKVIYDGNPRYFTTSGTTQYLKFRVEKGTTNIQLEEGETPTPYQEYYDGYRISGKSYGKNIFNHKDIIPSSYFTYNIDENTVTLTNNTEGVLWVNAKYRLKVKPNTIYNVSYKSNDSTPILSYRNKDHGLTGFKRSIEATPNSGFKGYFETGEGMTEIFIYLFITRGDDFPSNKGLTVKYKNIVIEEIDGVTTYEPYQESTYSYILDEPLRSLPNGVCDTIDLETGVLTRRVGKLVLDGSEDWKLTATTEDFIDIRYNIEKIIHKNPFDGMCNTIPYASEKTGWICVLERISLYLHTTLSMVIVSFPKTKADSLESFKQWLQANPTTILYELAEPTIHQLDQNRIYSFKDVTHITSDNLITPRITTNILTNSNALISHLKGENLALANEVSTLSLRNRETQETNETQDHIIDASLCAVDELYMMYETTQEVEAMSTDEEGSRMVDMYVAMVQRGLKTIDQVPVRYREKVREILAQLED